jgi:hypothetical protein
LNNKNPNIDQQLQDKFSEYAPMPVAFAWDQLDAKLEYKATKKRRFVLFTSVAASTIAVVASTIFYFGGQSNELQSENNKINHVVIEKNENNKIDNQQVDKLNIPTQTEVAEKINASMQVQSRSSASNNSQRKTVGDVIVNTLQIDEEVNTNKEISSIINYIVSEDFSSKQLEIFPIYFGNLLQSTLITLKPQEPAKRNLSAWALEVGYDQNQTSVMYSATPSLEKYVHKNYLERMKQSEFALSAAQLHFALRYKLSQKWSISAGLGWMQNRTQQNFHFRDSMPATLAQGNTADAYGNYPIFGYLGLGPEVNYEGISNISMISIPVGAIFEYPLRNKWSITSEALVQANYLTAQKGNTLNYQLLSLQDINSGVYRDLLWSAKVGVGVQKEISNRAKLGARINTQGMFTPLYKQNSAVQNRAWSVGLSAFYVWRLF